MLECILIGIVFTLVAFILGLMLNPQFMFMVPRWTWIIVFIVGCAIPVTGKFI